MYSPVWHRLLRGVEGKELWLRMHTASTGLPGGRRHGDSLDIPLDSCLTHTGHGLSTCTACWSQGWAKWQEGGRQKGPESGLGHLLLCRPPKWQHPCSLCATCWLMLALGKQVHPSVCGAWPACHMRSCTWLPSSGLLGGYSVTGQSPSQKERLSGN